MTSRCVQLVLQYDGARFSGWQRQPDERTVQGVLEEALERLCQTHIPVLGAGRTDAGVHALGQAAGVRVGEKWTPTALRRAMNATIPDDVWIKDAFSMRDDFHARYSAVSRSYRYIIGTNDEANSPFRKNRELPFAHHLDIDSLRHSASELIGDHCFRAFAVKGTAPESDDHHCTVLSAEWIERDGGLSFAIRANRFLHHMVRFLVGTMLDIAAGRREGSIMGELLASGDNKGVSPPAPAHALYLESVEYPSELYLAAT
ncbi:MAG TPA: tRNA pseudouridine(38-40) synthase TruA [Gemmatimonadaceae bacterium]|nr:tRNA pseudouridine(38-40) synthase TruA [Gemmatimonadaceae bacterium]